jgi:hypothetical protein
LGPGAPHCGIVRAVFAVDDDVLEVYGTYHFDSPLAFLDSVLDLKDLKVVIASRALGEVMPLEEEPRPPGVKRVQDMECQGQFGGRCGGVDFIDFIWMESGVA